MKIVIVNRDASWRFTPLTRMYALDLYRLERGVDIWQAAEGAETFIEEELPYWGDWPRHFRDSDVVLNSDLTERVKDLDLTSDDQLVMIFIHDHPPLSAEQSDTLDILAKLCKGDRRFDARLWRIVIFRCRPPESGPGNADRLVRDGLADTVIFIGNDGMRPSPEGQFAALRALLDVLQNDPDADKIFRVSGTKRNLSVAWLKAPPTIPHNHVLRVRRLLTEMVLEADNTGQQQPPGMPASKPDGGLVKDLANQVEKTLATIGTRVRAIDGETTVPTMNFEWDEVINSPPRFQRPNLELALDRAAKKFLNDLDLSLNERVSELEIEQKQMLHGYQTVEEDIVAGIARLSGSDVGVSGTAESEVIALAGKVEVEANELNERLITLRESISQNAAPMMAHTTAGTQSNQAIRRRFSEDEAFDAGCIAAAAAARRLMGPWSPVILAVMVLVLPLLPLWVFYAADSPNPLIPHALIGSFFGLFLGQWSWVHWVYILVFASVGWFVLFFVWRKSRRELTHAIKKMKASAVTLHRRAHSALEESLDYVNLTYALSWLNMTREQLLNVQHEFHLARQFATQFDTIRVGKRSGPERSSDNDTDLSSAKSTLSLLLTGSPRQQWLRRLLENWPVVDANSTITVKFGGVSQDRDVASSFFADNLTLECEALETDVSP